MKVFRYFVLALIVAMAALSTSAQTPSAFPYATPIPNDTSTGTTQFKLVKINSSGNGVITATSDTNGFVGVCVGNCGTSGTSWIAFVGLVPIVMDATATAQHYVQISSTTAGDGKDSGASTFPLSGGDVVGRVQVGCTGAACVAMVALFPPEVTASAGGTTITVNGSALASSTGNLNGTTPALSASTPPDTQLGVFAADASSPTNVDVSYNPYPYTRQLHYYIDNSNNGWQILGDNCIGGGTGGTQTHSSPNATDTALFTNLATGAVANNTSIFSCSTSAFRVEGSPFFTFRGRAANSSNVRYMMGLWSPDVSGSFITSDTPGTGGTGNYAGWRCSTVAGDTNWTLLVKALASSSPTATVSSPATACSSATPHSWSIYINNGNSTVYGYIDGVLVATSSAFPSAGSLDHLDGVFTNDGVTKSLMFYFGRITNQ